MQIIKMARIEPMFLVLFQIYQAKVIFDVVLMMHFIADDLIIYKIIIMQSNTYHHDFFVAFSINYGNLFFAANVLSTWMIRGM